MTKDLTAGPPMVDLVPVISVGVFVRSGPMSLAGANGASSSEAIIQISSKPLISASFSTVVARLSDERNPKLAKSILLRGFLNPLPPVALRTSNVDSGMAPPPTVPRIRVFGVVLDTGLTINYTCLGLHKLINFNFYYIKSEYILIFMLEKITKMIDKRAVKTRGCLLVTSITISIKREN